MLSRRWSAKCARKPVSRSSTRSCSASSRIQHGSSRYPDGNICRILSVAFRRDVRTGAVSRVESDETAGMRFVSRDELARLAFWPVQQPIRDAASARDRALWSSSERDPRNDEARRHHRLAGRALALAADAERRLRGARARLGIRAAADAARAARRRPSGSRRARLRRRERDDAAQARGRAALRDRCALGEHARRPGRPGRRLDDGRRDSRRAPTEKLRWSSATAARRRHSREALPQRTPVLAADRLAAGRRAARTSSSTQPPHATRCSSRSARARRSSISRTRRPRPALPRAARARR